MYVSTIGAVEATVGIVEAWEMSGRSWFWLYASLAAVLWVVVVLLLDGPLLWGTIYAVMQVEIGFRLVERVRRRRVRARS
jgi:hypothetical protein